MNIFKKLRGALALMCGCEPASIEPASTDETRPAPASVIFHSRQEWAARQIKRAWLCKLGAGELALGGNARQRRAARRTLARAGYSERILVFYARNVARDKFAGFRRPREGREGRCMPPPRSK